MPDLQQMFREYVHLDKKRSGSGVTPLEYQRWLDLGTRLERQFKVGKARCDKAGASRTRIVVSLKSAGHLRRSVIDRLKPVGLFLSTPFGPEQGTRFELCLQLEWCDESYRMPVEVASTNLGADLSTQSLGVGVRILQEGGDVSALLRRLRD